MTRTHTHRPSDLSPDNITHNCVHHYTTNPTNSHSQIHGLSIAQNRSIAVTTNHLGTITITTKTIQAICIIICMHTIYYIHVHTYVARNRFLLSVRLKVTYRHDSVKSWDQNFAKTCMIIMIFNLIKYLHRS